ncbi:MAG: VWA domain-containing protein [Planctomycetota bacterium]|nr:VWA domain-containing protein [Planctomycetota bacterium]
MLAALPIRFEQPLWLLVLLLIVPVFLISRRSIGGLSPTKAYVTFVIRSLLLALLAIALAEPIWVKRGEGLTAIVLLDRSQSIPLPIKREALSFLKQAAENKDRPEDRLACLTVARDASITALPNALSAVTVGSDVQDPTATNLAAGLRLALAIKPDDTANRIVLASDGNETVDSALAAAELAKANDVPVDVLLLEYEYDNEVIFDQIVAPPRARQGQTADIKLVLHSQKPATGTIRLKLNEEYLDLNGAEAGDGLRVELNRGLTALPLTISLDESGPHQFEGVFIPDDPAADAAERNNTAVAVTFVSGKGRVLVVDDGVAQSQYLLRALREAGITAERYSSDEVPEQLVFFSGYDAVVLVNMPTYAFTREQDRMLRAYVHDLGGGLVMIGGDKSFGAGGWIDTELAKALPVELNPPQTRQMPAGALALIMHSCEMPQGNFWGQKVAESAIKALSRLDYVGIVEYNWRGGGGGIQGCNWAYPMQKLGDKSGALNATKTMTVGDMPAFGPSMQLALQGLMSVPAAQRHAIIISDGDPSPPSGALLQKYIDNQVTITTVMVGGHGTLVDKNRMKAVAGKTGGQFYDVKNPKQLPQIFIKEAQFVSRSLIQDGQVYQPAFTSRLPGPTQGFAAVPALDGYVLTAPREGLAQTPIVIPTSEGNDPLFAHWNYGLGRSIAYTSDVSNLWGSRWAGWARFRAFWEQAIRWVMRPSSPTNMSVSTQVDGETAIVEIEALEADASFLNFLRTNAVVLTPGAESRPLPLQQTGPGRYRGQFRTDEAGAYLVNIAFAGGSGDAVEQGNLQAAVTVPYAREFRAVKHNAALLRQLAELTGGRVLDASDPGTVDLFYRGELEVARTPKPVWDFLAILAASLLLLDVAARRIALDARRVAGMAGRAVGRRGEVSTDALAAWKRTRAQVSGQRGRRKEKTETTARLRAARYEADEADAKLAIDVGADAPADRRDRPLKPRRARPEAADEGDEAEGDYTSRLLRAKRRARGEDDSDAKGDADA